MFKNTSIMMVYPLPSSILFFLFLLSMNHAVTQKLPRNLNGSKQWMKNMLPWLLTLGSSLISHQEN